MSFGIGNTQKHAGDAVGVRQSYWNPTQVEIPAKGRQVICLESNFFQQVGFNG